MIMIRRYSPALTAAWDAFVDASKNGTFMLKRGYMDYHSDRFVDHSLLFYEDDELVALLPASQHDTELRSHGGLTYGGLITSNMITVQVVIKIFDAIKEYMKENHIEKIIYKRIPAIYHKYPSDEDIYALYHAGMQLVRRDVSSAIYLPSKIKFSKRRIRGCKRAAKQGIVIKESNDYSTFISIVADILMKYHDTKPVHTAKELELLACRFPDNIKLYAAFLEEKMMAGVVMYETETVAHAQYIANSDEGKKIGALDAVMEYLINTKYADKIYFDFGISTEDKGMFLNEGLATQKQEFGGRAIVYDFFEIVI